MQDNYYKSDLPQSVLGFKISNVPRPRAAEEYTITVASKHKIDEFEQYLIDKSSDLQI